MEVYSDFRSLPPAQAPRVVTIGSFDGLHLGHQHLISRAAEWSRREGGELWVMTFDPHPARALAPELSPPLLMTPERKLRALSALGARRVLRQSFDREFAAMDGEAFVAVVLGRHLRAGRVVVGDDFTFGRDRTGRAADLIRLGPAAGIAVDIVPRLAVEGITVSSTAVRSFLLQGNVRGAELLLGRPYVIDGAVERGFGRGRKIGFPTLNVATSAELLPAPGVYVCSVWDDPARPALPAVTNVGTSPTFGPGKLRVEAHLLDASGDWVGRPVALSFWERLRPERTFGNVKALIAQIGRDVEQARAHFAAHPLPISIHPLDGIAWPGAVQIT